MELNHEGFTRTCQPANRAAIVLSHTVALGHVSLQANRANLSTQKTEQGRQRMIH